MSIKGFSVNGVVQRYDYTALDNLPQGQGVSDDLKAALLQLAQKVAYIDDQGQTYYDDLYDALYPEKTLLSIAANFQQGQAVVYNTDSLDSLKQYLTVTATYDDASTETVPSSAYTLSGTLTTGTSVITVTYEGKTDAFNVTVTAAPMSFTVTNNLTGCTTSNSATAVLENASYTAVITASSGYTLVGATVSITMGGNDITTSAYSGGIITINSVTGALVISVAAVAVVLNSISAVYTQSGTVHDTDTLDSLKDDLVVTAHYSDSSTAVIPSASYTLSGTLEVGISTITVSYGGKTTTFNVTVTYADPRTLLYRWDFKTSLIDTVAGKECTLLNSNSGSSLPTRDSDGLHFTAAEQVAKCAIGGLKEADGKTYELDISSAVFAGDNAKHKRLLTDGNSNGDCFLIFRNAGAIQMWKQNPGWRTFTAESGQTIPTSLNNLSGKTIGIQLNTNKSASLYINGTLIGTNAGWTVGNTSFSNMCIGGLLSGTKSDGQQIYNMTITGFRVYDA